MFRTRLWQSTKIGGVLVVLVLAGSLVSGCTQGGFVGRQYTNFTAYYNTFYNAEKAFEKGTESITQSEVGIERTRYQAVFPEPQASSGEAAFKEAIQKSADVLREHPNSKWVDDALLLIGKSYFYQQNYVGAAQKFREAMALESDREGEARYWLARTLLATERYAQTAEALSSGFEAIGEFNTWTARLHLVEGALLVQQERFEEAEQSLQRGLEGDLPDELAARAGVLLGQVRETLGDVDGARAAYRRVPDRNPPYRLEFTARLGAIELQGLHGNPEEALDRLSSLERDDDSPTMRGEIALVRARLYRAQGRHGRARKVLVDALRAELAPPGAIQGRIHYELGALDRDEFENFPRAAAHFDTARTSLSSRSSSSGQQAEQTPQLLPQAPSDVEGEAQRLSALANRAERVARLDSLLRLGRMSDEELQAYAEKIRKKRLAERQAAQESREREQQFQARGRPQSQSTRNVSIASQTGSEGAGFLFHENPAQVQESRRQFQQTWGDRPRVDNWRRQADIRSGSASDSGASESAGSTPPATARGEQGSEEVIVDLSVVPRDSASRAEMQANRAVARYQLATALLQSVERPDSAATWYKRILEEDSDHPVARRALYALAQAYDAQGDTAAARETYRRVIDEYPRSAFAEQARQQLGLNTARETSASIGSAADSAYARAYQSWQADSLDTALDAFLAVAETYPDTPAAPRALFGAAIVYRQQLAKGAQLSAQEHLHRYLNRHVSVDSVWTPSYERLNYPAEWFSTVPMLWLPLEAMTADSAAAGGQADSVGAISDTTTLAGDSTEGGRDSTGVSPDTAGVGAAPSASSRDTTATGSDTTAVPSDTSSANTDTTAAGRDTTTVDTDPVGGNGQPPAERDSAAVDTTSSGAAPTQTNPPDSTSNPTDRTARPADDTTTAPSTVDTTAQRRPRRLQQPPAASADSTVSPADTSTGSSSDTLAAGTRPDSSLAADTTRSVAAEERRVSPPDPLEALLTHLTVRYAESAHAERARSFLKYLREKDAPSDSLAPDSTAAPQLVDTNAGADTSDAAPASGSSADTRRATPDTSMSSRPIQSDSVRAPASDAAADSAQQQERASIPTPPRVPSTGPEEQAEPRTPIDPSAGGWTLSVQTFEARNEATAHLRTVEQQLSDRWPIDVITDSTQTPPQHRLVVGQFNTEESASRARERLSSQLSEVPDVWSFSAPAGDP